MDSVQFAILVIIQQISLARGAVNLTFDDYGYIGQSIVYQCKTDAGTIYATSAIWSLNGSIFSTTSSRFSETRTSDGFNLTISNLTTADAGYYVCGIDFGSSSNKTLGIVYNTQQKDVVIHRGTSAGTIQISIIAYPDPTYSVTVTEVVNGAATPVINVNWTLTKTTQVNHVINVTLTANNFAKETYNITVNVNSTWPRPVIVSQTVSFATTTTSTTNTNNGNTGAIVRGKIGCVSLIAIIIGEVINYI